MVCEVCVWCTLVAYNSCVSRLLVGINMARTSVFISYSHKDVAWLESFTTHLRVLEKQQLLEQWDDRAIRAGEDWQARISSALDAARVAVLLVSADFLSSDFVLREEIPTLLLRNVQNGLTIVPIIVRPCPWQAVAWLARMQVRPRNARPVAAGNQNQIDQDFSDIALEILEIVQQSLDARLLVFHPLLPSGCNACDAALEGDSRFQPRGEYAYAVNPHVIEVRSIESKETGWHAKGVGCVQQVKCPNCNMMYDAVLREIPIHCSSFTCPLCGGATHLNYRVVRIETSYNRFDFEAEITCEACAASNTIKSVIEDLHRAESIKISLPDTER